MPEATTPVATIIQGPGMVPNRRRRWHPGNFGMFVIMRHVIDDLTPGEDVTDDPPTVRLTRDEWLARHDEFGYTADFQRHDQKENQ